MADPKPTNFPSMSNRELYDLEQGILNRLRTEPMSQFDRNTLGMERAAAERRAIGRDSDFPKLLGYLIAQGVYDIPKTAYFASEPGSTTSNFLEAATRKILPVTPFNRQTTSPPNTLGNLSHLIEGYRERGRHKK